MACHSCALLVAVDLERRPDAEYKSETNNRASSRSVDYLHKNLRRFMRPERRHVALPMRLARACVEYQPLGVIGIVAPWNYPFSLALRRSRPRSPPATAR